jgi:hypothetical protein
VFDNKSKAEKAAGPGDEARFCEWGRHWHLWPAKQRKSSHGPQGGKRRGKR